jgi:hypothetical protein
MKYQLYCQYFFCAKPRLVDRKRTRSRGAILQLLRPSDYNVLL